MNSCRLHFILRNNSIMKHFTPFILLALLTAFSAQAKHPNILFIIADDQSSIGLDRCRLEVSA